MYRLRFSDCNCVDLDVKMTLLQHLPLFKDTNALHVHALDVLKSKLLAKFPNQVFRYDCSVAGVDSSTGMALSFDVLGL